MNGYLVGAAVLAGGTAIAHSYLGERYILIRLFRRTDLPHLFGSDLFTRRVLRFAWHLTSVAWLGFGAILAAAGGVPGIAAVPADVTLLRYISLTFVVTAAITLVGSRGRHLAWIIFLAIAAGAWLGAG